MGLPISKYPPLFLRGVTCITSGHLYLGETGHYYLGLTLIKIPNKTRFKFVNMQALSCWFLVGPP
jgi:hypothetical protein